MANPTAEWEKVGDKFYRKVQLYTAVFDQDLELENYIVTGCSYGGAIGTFRSYFTAIWIKKRRFETRFNWQVLGFGGEGESGLAIPNFQRACQSRLYVTMQVLLPLATAMGAPYRDSRECIWNSNTIT